MSIFRCCLCQICVEYIEHNIKAHTLLAELLPCSRTSFAFVSMIAGIFGMNLTSRMETSHVSHSPVAVALNAYSSKHNDPIRHGMGLAASFFSILKACSRFHASSCPS